MSETPACACDRHGDALPAAYVCRHLLEGTATGWHDAEDGELCPDAWCDACEQRRLAHDGWEGADVEIRLLCACCYHQIRGRQHAARTSWEALIREAVPAMQAANDGLEAEHHLFGASRWHYDADPLVLELGGPDGVFARCRALSLGSFSERTGTFLWGWANHSVAPVDRAPVAYVAGVGEHSGIVELTEAHAACELVDAWERAAVAAWLLGAVGLYRCPSEHLHLFLALMDVAWSGSSLGGGGRPPLARDRPSLR